MIGLVPAIRRELKPKEVLGWLMPSVDRCLAQEQVNVLFGKLTIKLARAKAKLGAPRGVELLSLALQRLDQLSVHLQHGMLLQKCF